MSVAEIPPTSCVSPTAVHVWLAPQDTPLRTLRPALGLLGVDRRVHAAPFQTSPSVLEKPILTQTCRPGENPYRGNGARDRFTSMGRGSANG